MFKVPIDYVDFNGVSRHENFYFNLTKAEMVELENSERGGLTAMLTRIINEEDNVKIIAMFKKIVLAAYGEKSQDGRRFVKSQDAAVAFTQTEAYSELIMKFLQDANFAADFINGVCSPVEADPTKKSFSQAVGTLKTV